MPLDTRTLDWTHDEEALGFSAPPRATPPRRTGLHRLAAALLGLGAFALVLTCAGVELGGGWSALLATFGLLGLGALLWFHVEFRDTPAGIRNDDTFFRGIQNRGLLGWALGLALTGFYVVLYFYDDWRAAGLPAVLERPTRLLDPLARTLNGEAASRWFLYGFLYTAAVGLFGVRTAWKYRHSRYQLVRTASVVLFQLVLAFLLPNLLRLFQQPEFYFSYFWPLKREYLFPDTLGGLWSGGGFAQFAVFWSVALALVGVPILTYFLGKRWYCSWVCGCGGLAETLGDPFRQQSVKTRAAWRVERWLIHAVLVLIVVTTALLWINSASSGRLLGGASQAFARFYGFWVGAIFSGVIGVGFYPLMGSRVWCRFGCPQAAILGLLQRLWSRFRITTNGGQCMSCGNCSTYCEMGIDVRAYAQRGANVVRAACVGCGVCAAVCPRGVLRLENGAPGERFEGADDPWGTFLDSLRRMEGSSYAAWEGSGRTGTGTAPRQ
ncbi:MAG TPA: 4Fe-4S dicluster domain-containing protein [Planctomycetota bacterium]